MIFTDDTTLAQQVPGNWAALTVFVDDGSIAADNNLSDRAMRPVALSGKNWLFAGSERGAAGWLLRYSSA